MVLNQNMDWAYGYALLKRRKRPMKICRFWKLPDSGPAFSTSFNQTKQKQAPLESLIFVLRRWHFYYFFTSLSVSKTFTFIIFWLSQFFMVKLGAISWSRSKRNSPYFKVILFQIKVLQVDLWLQLRWVLGAIQLVSTILVFVFW